MHKEKTSFPLSQSRHREIDKTMRDIPDFAGAERYALAVTSMLFSCDQGDVPVVRRVFQ